MLRNIGTIAGLLAGLALGVPTPARAGDGATWVEVTGEAAIVSGNQEAAKSKALDQALRQAVEQVAGTIVSGISQSKNFMTVRDEITSQGAGFVERYQREKTTCSAETCKVTVKALVAKGKLRNKLDKLGLLVQQHGYPRMILLISEQTAGGQAQSWWGGGGGNRSQVVENTLIQYLNKVVQPGSDKDCKGAGTIPTDESPVWPADQRCWHDLTGPGRFRFVDYTSIIDSPVVRKAGGAKLSNSEAVSIARLTDAEVALVGSASAQVAAQEGDSGSLVGAKATVGAARLTLRLIDVASGKVLGTATGTMSHLGYNEASATTGALQDVAREVVPQIQKVIADAWQTQSYGSRWVEIHVHGLKSYTELLKFQGLLKTGVTGVQAVEQRRMSGHSAILEVQCTGTAQALATELSSRPLGKMSVNVTRVEPGVVGLSLSE